MKACLVLSLALLISFSALDAKAESNTHNLMLVFPARPAVVQTAFDAAWLRPIQLVSYDTDRDNNLLMWRWQPAERTWSDLTVESFRRDILLREQKPEVLIIGDDPAVVQQIEQAAVWADTVETLHELSKLPVFNRLDKSLNFSASEWSWLAGRHGIILQDVNLERRRHGRWGVPDKRKEKAPQPIIPEIRLEPRRGVSPRADEIIIGKPAEPITIKPVIPAQKKEAEEKDLPFEKFTPEHTPPLQQEKGALRKDPDDYQPIDTIPPAIDVVDEVDEYIK